MQVRSREPVKEAHGFPTPPPNEGRARTIRIVVYTLLLLSTGTTFIFGNRLWFAASTGTLPLWGAALPPLCFVAFVVVYSIDRWLLVQKQQYPAGRALFQIAFALVFLTALLPKQALHYKNAKSQRHHTRPVTSLLKHRDPSVRAAVCELLKLRREASARNLIEPLATGDPSFEVRTHCSNALKEFPPLKQTPAPKTPPP